MQKRVNLVDLVKSSQTSIYLQKSASIQPRTSLSKFGGDSITFFNSLLRQQRAAPAATAGSYCDICGAAVGALASAERRLPPGGASRFLAETSAEAAAAAARAGEAAARALVERFDVEQFSDFSAK